MSRFDWPLNTPVAPPPQRVSYKQRLVRMRQGVVGGRFLHTISSGKALWKTRTIGDLSARAVVRRSIQELLRIHRFGWSVDSMRTGATHNQCFSKMPGRGRYMPQGQVSALISGSRGGGAPSFALPELSTKGGEAVLLAEDEVQAALTLRNASRMTSLNPSSATRPIAVATGNHFRCRSRRSGQWSHSSSSRRR